MENYKLLKINCILNNVKDILCEHVALGDKEGKMVYRYLTDNHGGLRVQRYDAQIENIEIKTLKQYIAVSAVNASEISYIWI